MMVPMVKFGLFDTDLESDVNQVESNVSLVLARIAIWKEFLSENNIQNNFVRISHTDQDMLTITFPLKFSKPTPLNPKEMIDEFTPILNSLQKLNLL